MRKEIRRLLTQWFLGLAFWICPENDDTDKSFKIEFAKFLISNIKKL